MATVLLAVDVALATLLATVVALSLWHRHGQVENSKAALANSCQIGYLVKSNATTQGTMTLNDAITRCLNVSTCTGFTTKSDSCQTCGLPRVGQPACSFYFLLARPDFDNNKKWRSWIKPTFPTRHIARQATIIWVPPMAVAIVLALTSVCNSVAFCCSRCSCLLLVSIVSNTVVGAACALAGATALVDFSALHHWLEDINCGGQRTPAGDECLVSSTGLHGQETTARTDPAVAIGCFALPCPKLFLESE